MPACFCDVGDFAKVNLTAKLLSDGFKGLALLITGPQLSQLANMTLLLIAQQRP